MIWAGVNAHSVTQLNDVKLNPTSKISPLAGTQMSAQTMHRKVCAWHLAAAPGSCYRYMNYLGYKWTMWHYCSNKSHSGLMSGVHINVDFCKQLVGAQVSRASDSCYKDQPSFGLTQHSAVPAAAGKCTHALNCFSLLA